MPIPQAKLKAKIRNLYNQISNSDIKTRRTNDTSIDSCSRKEKHAQTTLRDGQKVVIVVWFCG